VGHRISGTGADAAYRVGGHEHEHAIHVAGHGRPTGVSSGTRAGRGEHVGLRRDPRLLPVQRRVRGGGPAVNGAGRALSRAPNGASHVLNDACQVRNRPSQLVTVSHLGSDHA
jgi:hypothetical protein